MNPRRSSSDLPWRALALSGVLCIAASLGPGACVGTGGRVITLTISLETTDESRFTTTTGWEITLREARLGVVALRAYDTSSPTASIGRALMPVARAHGGIEPYSGAPLRAEWLGPASLNLLSATPIVLGSAQGTAGPTRVVTLTLGSAPGDPTLRGHVAWVSGEAFRAGLRIPFEGGIDLASEGTEALVDDLPLDAGLDDESTMWLRASPAAWLDGAHFDRLPDRGDGSPRSLASGTQPALAWHLAILQAATYSLRVDTPRGP